MVYAKLHVGYYGRMDSILYTAVRDPYVLVMQCYWIAFA